MRVLFVLTSHGTLGDTRRATGYYLSEVSHAYYILRDGGAEVTFASIAGGRPPMDGAGRDDPDNARFLDDRDTMAAVESTIPLARIDPRGFDAVYFPGGHGAMWDFPDHPEVQRVVAAIWEQGGLVAAVCHGPAALTSVRLSDGSYLVTGRTVAAFTDDEERAQKLTGVVPFLLSSRLRERGAKLSEGAPFTAQVAVDGRLITGQNPASARPLARELLESLASGGANPPAVAAPAGAVPVTVTLRLRAVDATALRKHLLEVIPVTRRAAGCRSSRSFESTANPDQFLLVQEWDSVEQQQAYIEWRRRRGDLAQFRSLLREDPAVDAFALFDR